MKKSLVILASLFIGIFNVHAGTYTGWEHKDVNELPPASEDTSGYVYDVNGKYYVSVLDSTESVNVAVGDSFTKGDYIYLQGDNLKENIINYLTEKNCISFISTCRVFSTQYSAIGLYYDGSDIMVYWNGSNQFTLAINSDIVSYQLNYISSTVVTVKSIDIDYLANFFYKSLGSISYKWQEISYYDWFEFNPDSTDYYLFYSFTDISNFDIFDWVDFTAFTDFEKVCTVLLVNILYCIIWLLVIYVFLKAFNKLISWCFR